MIDAIEIENLRGIRHGRLDGLKPLTILTGPNASGKSTVLDALLIAATRSLKRRWGGPSSVGDEAVARELRKRLVSTDAWKIVEDLVAD
jgi:predicted ATPase